MTHLNVFFSSQYECLLLCVIVFWTHYVDHRWHFPHYINKMQIVYYSFFHDQEPYVFPSLLNKPLPLYACVKAPY